MRLAYCFLPGIGVNWGQEPVLVAPEEWSQGFHSGWQMLDTPRAVDPPGDLTPLTTRFLNRIHAVASTGPLVLSFLQSVLSTCPSSQLLSSSMALSSRWPTE